MLIIFLLVASLMLRALLHDVVGSAWDVPLPTGGCGVQPLGLRIDTSGSR